MALLMPLLAPAGAPAQPSRSDAASSPNPGADPIAALRRARDGVAEATGLNVEAGYTLIWQWADPVNDGRNTLLTGSFDLAGTWTPPGDLDESLGHAGFLVEGGQILTGDANEDLSANVGSGFGLNDDLDNTDIAVTELWWTLPAGRWLDREPDALTLTVGKIDQTVYFDQNAVANDETTQFLATPFVNNPAIAFPDNGLGANMRYQMNEAIYLTAGLGDADAVAKRSGFNTLDADHLFVAAELGADLRLFDQPGRYRVTLWHSDPSDAGSGAGIAFNFDQHLSEQLLAFGRFASADDGPADFDAFAAAGLGITGPLGRADDLFAVGYAWGRPTGGDDTEQLIETFYRLQLTDWAALSPHVQVILDPASGTEDTAVTAGARLQVGF